MNRKNAASFYFILASIVLLFCAVLSSGCTGYSGEESFVLDAGNYTFYEFEMFEGEQLDALITARQSPVDIYVLDSENLYRYENMGNFQYERYYQNSLSTNVEFTASYDGYWYMLLINNENQDVRLDISFEVY